MIIFLHRKDKLAETIPYSNTKKISLQNHDAALMQ
jgi:hypothetical protein